MILYTTQKAEMIFPQKNPQIETKDFENRTVETIGGKINRIISTNPADYLDENLQIGKTM